MFGQAMLQTAHVARYLSTDARGDETHAAAAEIRVRYEPSTRLIRTSNGAQSVSEAALYTEAEVTESDLVWPPGADSSSISESRKPLRVEKHWALDGAFSHYVVHI